MSLDQFFGLALGLGLLLRLMLGLWLGLVCCWGQIRVRVSLGLC